MNNKKSTRSSTAFISKSLPVDSSSDIIGPTGHHHLRGVNSRISKRRSPDLPQNTNSKRNISFPMLIESSPKKATTHQSQSYYHPEDNFLVKNTATALLSILPLPSNV